MTDSIPIKSVAVTFDLIERIVELGGAGASQLASDFDMPVSTVHSHLQTLETIGYLSSENGCYHVTSRFLRIGKKSQLEKEIYVKSRDTLAQLAENTGEYISLMVEEGGLGVNLHFERGEKASRVKISQTYPGVHTKLHTSATGKAILAELPESRVRAILDEHGMESRTERTITSPTELFDELAEIGARGYAIDDEERMEGMRGVAAPVSSSRERMHGSIGLYGPTNRLTDQLFYEEYPQQILEAANVIQVSLNYS